MKRQSVSVSLNIFNKGKYVITDKHTEMTMSHMCLEWHDTGHQARNTFGMLFVGATDCTTNYEPSTRKRLHVSVVMLSIIPSMKFMPPSDNHDNGVRLWLILSASSVWQKASYTLASILRSSSA